MEAFRIRDALVLMSSVTSCLPASRPFCETLDEEWVVLPVGTVSCYSRLRKQAFQFASDATDYETHVNHAHP